jgi:hypothetical protein
MFLRSVLLGAATVVAACVTGPAAHELAQQCNVKYREESPPGATIARPISPLRPSGGALRDYRSSYACVAISVNERGEVTDAKLLETDKPQFGEYFLKLTSQAKYTPGALNGNSVATKGVITIVID